MPKQARQATTNACVINFIGFTSSLQLGFLSFHLQGRQSRAGMKAMLNQHIVDVVLEMFTPICFLPSAILL